MKRKYKYAKHDSVNKLLSQVNLKVLKEIDRTVGASGFMKFVKENRSAIESNIRRQYGIGAFNHRERIIELLAKEIERKKRPYLKKVELSAEEQDIIFCADQIRKDEVEKREEYIRRMENEYKQKK